MSSVTGAGVKEFFDAVDASRIEYEKFVHYLFALVMLAHFVRF